MPSISNITKKVESTSIHTESTSATLVKNTVATQVNGVSPNTQNYTSSSLNVSDYSGISQAQQQSGYFISKTDNPTIGSRISDYTSYQQDSALLNVGAPYNYVSDIVAENKDNRIVVDYKEKEDSIISSSSGNMSYWGEEAVTDSVETISFENEFEKAKQDSLRLLNRDTTNWKLYGGELMKGKGRANMDWCVTIMEDRDSIEKIASEGEFGTDLVKVFVYQRVGNFSFGTAQSFQSVSPRGSQTPLRFYENNGGRVLSFSAEFHQQEFPLEPLLSIAEKLQYLARPYRHGDYSLIPKLVRITIPGRTFRGYLTSVDIGYQGEDYTSWNSEEIKNALQASDWGGTYQRFGSYDYKNAPNYRPNLNSNDAVTYGMEKMNASIQLAIVEEIKLTQYTTFEEKQRQYIQDNQERAYELRSEVAQQWTEAVAEVGYYLQTDEGRSLVDEEGRPYSEYPPEDLIYVDKATGEVLRTPDGQVLTVYNKLYEDERDPYIETMSQYNTHASLQNMNTESPNYSVFEKQEDTLSGLYTLDAEGNTIPKLIADILTLQKNGYISKDPPWTEEELQSKTIEELYQIKKDSFLITNAGTLSLVGLSDFFIYYDKKDGVQSQKSYLATEQNLQNFQRYLTFKLESLENLETLYAMIKKSRALTFINEDSIPDTKIEYSYFGISKFHASGVTGGMGASYNLPSSYAVCESLGNYGEYKLYINLVDSEILGQKYKDWIVESGKSGSILIINNNGSSSFQDISALKKEYTYIDNITGKTSDAILTCILSTMQAMLLKIPDNFTVFLDYMKNTFSESGIYPTENEGSKRYKSEGYNDFFYISST